MPSFQLCVTWQWPQAFLCPVKDSLLLLLAFVFDVTGLSSADDVGQRVGKNLSEVSVIREPTRRMLWQMAFCLPTFWASNLYLPWELGHTEVLVLQMVHFFFFLPICMCKYRLQVYGLQMAAHYFSNLPQMLEQSTMGGCGTHTCKDISEEFRDHPWSHIWDSEMVWDLITNGLNVCVFSLRSPAHTAVELRVTNWMRTSLWPCWKLHS